jgi:uncharacterized protein (DUF1015 family)
MAQILPFHALRYNTAGHPLADLLTQPYDKITPAMQKAYYERDPYNLVRFELGMAGAADSETDNVYTRAKSFLAKAKADGVLQRDEKPAIYAYAQRFENPAKAGEWIERRGFLALGRIHNYDEGVVYRHEQTLDGPKADRAKLLATARTHSGQIFMLYEDPALAIDKLLWGQLEGRTPQATITDEYGVENSLWVVDDPQLIGAVAGAMSDKRLIIADGHHRYETALRYRDQQGAGDGKAPHDYVLMTFVNQNAPGLVVLPTHRVVFGLENFDQAALQSRLEEYFHVAPARGGTDVNQVLGELQEAGIGGSALALTGKNGSLILRARHDAVEKALADEHPLRRKLDVVLLHKIILEKVLGLSQESINQQRNIHYHRSAASALTELEKGANCVFLLNPTPMAAMRDLSYAGEVMPQKSTDFYPKLLSGLALYELDGGFAQPNSK